MNRRHFLSRMAAASSLACVPTRLLANQTGAQTNRYPICAFIKFVQSLPYDELAETIAELGYDGIEATVRSKGHVLPERVEEDLPKLVEALKKYDLKIHVMASDINSIDQPLTEKVLRTAAALGIKRYRMKYYTYDLEQPILDQLRSFQPVVRDLVAMNKQFGLQAVYQNHAGAKYVGASLWDLYELLKDHDVNHLAAAFDIRHATAEAGTTWPVRFSLLTPHLGVVYFKDFVWEGRRPANVPLGKGQVDPAFVGRLKKTDFHGPLSVHVEYLGEAGLEENIAGLKQDLATLRSWLEA